MRAAQYARMNHLETVPATTEETAIEPTRKIRAELNLEQWAIWLPAKSKSEPKPRVLTKEITLDNGDKINAEVEMTASRKGTLTTEDQKTYYTLIELWEAQGRPATATYFSLNGLLKRQGKKWGSRNIETLKDSLTRLGAVTFIWNSAYHDALTQKTHKTLELFRIIEKLKVKTTEEGGVTNKAEGYFKFTDDLLSNLNQNYSKPVLLDVVLGFKSEVAQIIYTQLDRILSRDISSYEKRTKELFADLGLEGRKYAYPAGRKQLLDPAIAELENAPLSNGATIASVKLEKTADGKDYKIVVKRGRARAKNATPAPRSSESQENPHSKEERPSESRVEAKIEVREAEQKGSELIAYFQQEFFGADRPTTKPAQKHRDLADRIIASHGETVSRYIVDFAKTEAEKTNYRIATFGAIANYVDRAVAGYTLEQAKVKRRQEWERTEAAKRAGEHAAQERWELSLRLYNELPEQERIELTNYYQAILATGDEWKDNKFTDSLQRKLFESAVKTAIRDHLLSRHEAGR